MKLTLRTIAGTREGGPYTRGARLPGGRRPVRRRSARRTAPGLLRPSYLRVLLTTRCTLDCTYCHGEGVERREFALEEIAPDDIAGMILAGTGLGVAKVKFLGGEPLLYQGLPRLLRRVKASAPHLDTSIITAGCVSPRMLDAAFQAGLDRANMSIHGWTLPAFSIRTGKGAGTHALRGRFLERLLSHGRPTKLNFVWRGPQDDDDLQAFLDWAARVPAVVGLLDDLGQEDLGPGRLLDTLSTLRGRPVRSWRDHDPHSLDTLQVLWADGLLVEIKDRTLGGLAPWSACSTCLARGRCREGIFALRLDNRGRLLPCMDRPDLGIPLQPTYRRGGVAAVAREWTRWLEGLAGCQPLHPTREVAR